ncbi:acyl carrier protein [Kitasatospora sp. NPDC050543]|uniref:acyl carrier protein n=1 Tax=Kitasatospora sp. NPDC050543 TaxID=3364054 RepID=UPI003797C66D
MVQASSALAEVEEWILARNEGVSGVGPDTDLIEGGLLTSLSFVELTFLLGRITGQKLRVDELHIDQFRTLRAIGDNFLAGARR